MKKILVCILSVMLFLHGQGVLAFSDVKKGDVFYQAINEVSERGILNGYPDGTFRPYGTITRAEATAVVVRASEMELQDKKSIYRDVPDYHWAREYVMSATDAGIINGMGNGLFEPDGKVTHSQIIKMIVCMMGLGGYAEEHGGWPMGYIEAAVVNDVIPVDVYLKIINGYFGYEEATRGAVAGYLYNVFGEVDDEEVYVPDDDIEIPDEDIYIEIPDEEVDMEISDDDVEFSDKNEDENIIADRDKLTVDGSEYYIGMNSSELGSPDEILKSSYGFEWYVFGTKTYKDFFAAGVADGKVVALASSGVGFEYNGVKSGDTVSSESEFYRYLLCDKNDGNIVHAVFIKDSEYITQSDNNKEVLEGESVMNFHFTNGFRVYHGQKILKWCDDAAKAAKLHSQDMADNNYFSHESQDGKEFSERLNKQGIGWSGCAENISAGRNSGLMTYDGWVNSSGHRKNMLNDYDFLGVGVGYNEKSSYGWYFTQDFYR